MRRGDQLKNTNLSAAGNMRTDAGTRIIISNCNDPNLITRSLGKPGKVKFLSRFSQGEEMFLNLQIHVDDLIHIADQFNLFITVKGTAEPVIAL